MEPNILQESYIVVKVSVCVCVCVCVCVGGGGGGGDLCVSGPGDLCSRVDAYGHGKLFHPSPVPTGDRSLPPSAHGVLLH